MVLICILSFIVWTFALCTSLSAAVSNSRTCDSRANVATVEHSKERTGIHSSQEWFTNDETTQAYNHVAQDGPVPSHKWNQSPMYLQLRVHGDDKHHNVMFCMIPKNACSEFLALILRMQGANEHYWNPTTRGAKFDAVHDPSKEHLSLFFRKSKTGHLENFNQIMKDRAWIKGVFLRDPVDRFLSAYQSKINTSLKSEYNTKYPAKSVSEMVDILQHIPVLEWDPHFLPQSYICYLQDSIEHYSFVGFFDDLESDARKMVMMMAKPTFEQAFSSEMLDHGWGPLSNQSLFGVARVQRDNDPTSQTDSKELRRLMDKYLLARIKNLYKMDYALLERAKVLRSRQHQ